MKKEIRLTIVLVALFIYAPINAQMIGGTGSNDPSPKEAKVHELSPTVLSGDVDLFTGRYSATHPLGSVSTPGGLGYELALQYSPTLISGATPPILSGGAYGEGWGLNIPTITITKLYAHQRESNVISPCLDFHDCETLDMDDPLGDGKGYWMAPTVNIPGVASGRAVFKRFNERGAEFVLHSFDNYLELTYDGSTWTIKANDGKVYKFGGVPSTKMPTNHRSVDYEQMNQYLRDPAGYGGTETVQKLIKNSIEPKSETLSWSCTMILDPVHLPGDKIYFKYKSYGSFNFYQELNQPLLAGALDLELDHSPAQEVFSFENPLMPWPSAGASSQESLLQEVIASSLGGYFEQLVLEYEVDDLGDNLLASRVIPTADPENVVLDEMYVGEVVYQAKQGSLDKFDDWGRYLHAMSDESLPEVDPTTLNPVDPYLVDGTHYRRAAVSNGSNQVAFDHAFLESPGITSAQGLLPGDIYEVRTKVSGNLTEDHVGGSLDLFVALGDPSTTSGDILKTIVNPDIKLFSTFDRAVKWNLRGSSGGEVHTSNFFMMPGQHRGSGGSGAGSSSFKVCIGPSNSDNDFGMEPGTNTNPHRNVGWGPSGTKTPSSYQSYAHHKWYLNNDMGLPDGDHTTGGTLHTYLAHNPIPSNFGIGLPWSMMLGVEKRLLANGFAPDGGNGFEPEKSDAFQFWWNVDPNDQEPGYDWDNEPTRFNGNDVTLDEVQVIRYAKQPLLLQSVKKYFTNGEYGDPESDGQQLVAQVNLGHEAGHRNFLEPDAQWYQAPLEDDIQMTGNTMGVVVLLKEVVNVAVDPTDNDGQGLLPISECPITRFDYKSGDQFNDPNWPAYQNGVWDCSLEAPFVDGISPLLKEGYLLSTVKHPLGGQTDIVYNDLRNPELRTLFGGTNLIVEENDPGYCDDRFKFHFTGNLTITPTVKEIIQKDGTTNGKVTSYEYQNKLQRTTSKIPNPSSKFKDISGGNSSRFGYGLVTITGPELSSGERNRTEHEFYGSPAIPTETVFNGPVEVHHYLNNSWPTENDPEAMAAHLFFGRLKEVREYDHNAALIRKTEETYEYLKAFYGGILRNNVEHYPYQPEYLDMMPGAQQQPFPDPDMLGTAERPWRTLRFMEIGINAELPTGNTVQLPPVYLNSYFVKKTRSKVTEYDQNGCVKDDAPPITVYPNSPAPLSNAGGGPVTNNATNQNKATLIATIENGLDENAKSLLLANSPLEEEVVEKVIEKSASGTTSILKDVLNAQPNLTAARTKQLMDKTDTLSEGEVKTILEARTYLPDSVYIEMLNSRNLSSRGRTEQFLEPPHLSTEVLTHMLHANFPLSSTETEQVFTNQPALPFSLLVEVVNSDLTGSSKANILNHQRDGLGAEVFHAMTGLFSTAERYDWIEDVLVHGPTYPDESFLMAMLNATYPLPSSTQKNILLASDNMFSTSLRSAIALSPHIHDRDKQQLQSSFNWVDLGSYCENDMLEAQIKIESITDYEYFDAAHTGITTSNGFKALMGLENEPSIQLLWEPSWQLYSTKTYSPQLPGAYKMDEYFYYQDLRNRYDRHWDLLDGTIAATGYQFDAGNVPQDPLFGVPRPENIQYNGATYQPITTDFTARLNEFNFRSAHLFEHRTRVKNDRSSEPVISSTYHYANNRWNEIPDGNHTTVTISGPPCPPDGLDVGNSGNGPNAGDGPTVDDVFKLHSANWANWTMFIDQVPIGYSLVAFEDEFYLLPNVSFDNTDEDIIILHVEDDPNNQSSSGSPKFLVVADFLKDAIQTRSIHMQADERKRSDLPGVKLFTESLPLMDFWEYDDGNNQTVNEMKPWFPYRVILKDSILERNGLQQVQLKQNERGLQTKYHYTEIATIWYHDPNNRCNNHRVKIYDERGLPQKVTVGFGRPDALETEFSYHPDGSIASITDPNGMELSYQYDDFGRLHKSLRGTQLLSVNNYHTYDNPDATAFDFDGSANENYVETFQLRNEGSAAAVQTRAFMDPLGRNYGSIARTVLDYENPGQASEMVFSGLTLFDAWDREEHIYKPFLYEDGGNPFNFEVTPTVRSANANEAPLYHSSSLFENTPRSRPLFQSKPGEDILTGHTVKYRYKLMDYLAFACEAGLNAGQAEMLMPDDEMDYVYAMTEVEDEDGKISREYSNAFGQKVATQQFVDAYTPALTLYLYNDQGALERSINPEQQETTYKHNLLGQVYEKQTTDGATSKGGLITTKYMYDVSGNMVVEQDEELRNGELNQANSTTTPKYRVYEYDDFNRLISQSVRRLAINGQMLDNGNTISSTPTDLLAYAEVLNGTNASSFEDLYVNGAFDPEQYITDVNLFSVMQFSTASTTWEHAWQGIWDTDGSPGGAGIGVYTASELLVDRLPEKEWHYDGVSYSYDPQTGVETGSISAQAQVDGRSQLKGRLSNTVTWPNTTYDQLWDNISSYYDYSSIMPVLYEFFNYDNVGQLDWHLQQFNATGISASDHGRQVRIDHDAYDLLGNLLTQNIDVDNNGTLDVQHHYVYDDWGRLSEVYMNQSDLGANGRKLASYAYNDALGLLTKTTYWGTCNGTEIETDEIVQHYDIRDRLTQIAGTFYTEDLYYDAQLPAYQGSLPSAITLQGHQNYNGNINGLKHTYTHQGMTNWQQDVMDKPSYAAFQYDGLNRLTQVDGIIGDLVWDVDNPGDPLLQLGDATYTFDLIGNFNTLERKVLDVNTLLVETEGWDYQYTGGTNRLESVQPSMGSISTARNYSYDDDGNLLTDDHRGLSGNTYGRANLSFQVTQGNDFSNYLYDAKDMRIFKENNDGNITKEFYLRDATGRELGILNLLPGGEPSIQDWEWYAFGAQRFASTTFDGTDKYSYLNHDHLGNTRLKYSKPYEVSCGAGGNSLYTLQLAADYYPYGKILRADDQGGSRYLTTHHERDTETGLDYRGARVYDSDVARFLSLDPLADDYLAWSDYNYVLGNPAIMTDPDGKSAYCPTCPRNGNYDEYINSDSHYEYDDVSKGVKKLEYGPQPKKQPSNPYFPITVSNDGAIKSESNQTSGRGEDNTKTEALGLALTVEGSTLSLAGDIKSNPVNGSWLGNNGQMAKHTNKGNQYLGGRTTARTAGKLMRYGGTAFTATSWALTTFKPWLVDGNMGDFEFGVETTSAVIGSIPIIGIPWTIGFEAGKAFGPSTWFQNDTDPLDGIIR